MKKLNDAVEKNRRLILDAERYIWQNPETGYKEFKTHKYMQEKFLALGYELTYADGITGFTTEIDTGKDGPTLLILGELDSIICPTHPESDKETGAVHSCGHNAQCAALLGVAAALKEDGVLDGLCGKIRLCAVPAEELLEIEFRTKLKNKGVIKYMGGKSEFLSRGLFDGVDLAFMVHTTAGTTFTCRLGSVGCIPKTAIFKGKAAHAGGSPWNGVNALYAANCGLNACNALRETFKDADLMRFHPIITKGGDMVNAIPETAVLEAYVRGLSYEAIVGNNKKINRALVGSALSLGANVEIIDAPGYAPHINDKGMMEVAEKAVKEILPDQPFTFINAFLAGSTDMGDLSCIMPIVHPYAGGAQGNSHGNDYYIVNPELACVGSAKWQLAMMKILLENNAVKAKEIIKNFVPRFSKESFLAMQDSLNDCGERITYADGKAEVRI